MNSKNSQYDSVAVLECKNCGNRFKVPADSNTGNINVDEVTIHSEEHPNKRWTYDIVFRPRKVRNLVRPVAKRVDKEGSVFDSKIDLRNGIVHVAETIDEQIEKKDYERAKEMLVELINGLEERKNDGVIRERSAMNKFGDSIQVDNKSDTDLIGTLYGDLYVTADGDYDQIIDVVYNTRYNKNVLGALKAFRDELEMIAN